ncbi:MAG: haloacid dehalogenase [Burkholderiales bacterium PBB5]|nr:MAG: haloacid dehalogenase [Burkholderiales bacterium PBB5]
MSGGPNAARPRVVFDFAGVLFHWKPLDLLQHLLPQHATDDASAAFWAALIFQGYKGDWAEFDRGTIAPGPLVDRIAVRTGLAHALVKTVVDAVPHSMHALPGSVALVEQLRAAGEPLFFLSNMPAPYADVLERANPFLRGFQDGVFSARVQLIKPEPAIFAHAAQRFGLPPQDLLFFDDVPANVAAARAAGWQAEVFTDAQQAGADLRARGFTIPG